MPALHVKLARKAMTCFILLAFLVSGNVPPLDYASAQEALLLPSPTARLELSPVFTPPLLKGIRVYPNDPFRLDFILDNGEAADSAQAATADSARLIRYFLAALTVPEKDIWVNLSPFEQDRIVPEAFGHTEMGRDLLAQDYILKQITASVIYPENKVGQEFWAKVYAEAMKRYGTTDVPVDTFNKVWILPERATVYENRNAAFVIDSHLKVMLEEDYLALEASLNDPVVSGDAGRPGPASATNKLGSDIVREVVIPILEKEVNEGKNFALLRQVYHSLILATWYKRKVKAGILGEAYIAQKKTAGIEIDDWNEKEAIWQQYVEAFKTGAYNLIKEEYDPGTQSVIPRKYFSGGFIADAAVMDQVMAYTDRVPGDAAMKGKALVIDTRLAPFDAAMSNQNKNQRPWDEETIRPEINRLISTSSRPKQLRYVQITTEQVPDITGWLFSPEILPSAPLLKQIIFNIYTQSTSGDKKVAEGWLSLLAQKWNLNPEILNRLLTWFKQNRTFATEVAEPNLYQFMQAYVTGYQQTPELRKSFIYNLPSNLSGDAQLALATENMNRMARLSTSEFSGTKVILKAPIEGTPYFIGFQYGLAESTHGLYLALGRERQAHDPLNGTFFRIGLDTQDGALRVIMMQGLAGAEKEINEVFPNTVGLHPGVALLYVAAALAEQGHLRYTEAGLETAAREPFQRLSGIRPEFIPTLRNGTPSIGMVERSTLEKASPTNGSVIFDRLKKDGLMKGGNSHGYIRANVRTVNDWLQKNFPLEINAILSVMRPDPVQLMINYARFGLRKSTSFDRWQETEYLTQELIPERIKRGDVKSKAIVSMTDAFRNLKPIVVKYMNTEDELQRTELTDVNLPPENDRAMSGEKPVNLFSGELKGRVFYEQAGQYRVAKVVKSSELKAQDRRDFAKALLDMSRKPGVTIGGKVLSVSHLAMGVAQNAVQEEIYAAVDEETSAVLALQVVEKTSAGNATMRLWISADARINFIANQILAYSIQDLLSQGVGAVNASGVSYTRRVREAGLLDGVNDIPQMQTFLANNARGAVDALRAATGNPSAQAMLARIDAAQMTAPGGIDFNPDKIALETKNSGEAITFNIDPAQLARVQQAAGLAPVIVNVVPLASLSQFLGASQ